MAEKPRVTRRDFLKSGAEATAGLAAIGGATFIARPGRIFGASDRVRLAVCGVRGRGWDHIQEFSKLPDVEVAALCDIDQSVLARRFDDMSKKGWARPRAFTDVRKLLEDKSIDAISIATPNHWHSLMAIWGCQAGKDVYCEKPCSHNVWEGGQIVQAAKKYNRIVQHGTQSRSASAIREAVGHLRSGLIGEVYLALRGICAARWRDTIGKCQPEPVPPGVDYDLWTGPRSPEAFHQESLSLQLALDLGHRQRGHRKSRRARNGHCPLGSRPHLAQPRVGRRRPPHVRRRSADAEHAQFRLRIRSAGRQALPARI